MYGKTRDQGFGAEVKRRILMGTYALSAGYYDAFYKRAQQVKQQAAPSVLVRENIRLQTVVRSCLIRAWGPVLVSSSSCTVPRFFRSSFCRLASSRSRCGEIERFIS